MNTNPECYIISANRPQFDKAYAARMHDRLGKDIQHAKKEVEGCYKGEREASWLVVPHERDGAREDIIRLISDYGQECALYLDANREAYYLYPDGKTRHIGAWVAATGIEGDSGDYTRDISTGRRYTVTRKVCGAIGAYDAIEGNGS